MDYVKSPNLGPTVGAAELTSLMGLLWELTRGRVRGPRQKLGPSRPYWSQYVFSGEPTPL